MVAKRILITGCSSGIGRDAALSLARAGHTVVATARSLDAIADLPQIEPRITVAALDVTNPGQRQAVLREHSPIHVLINNAGYGLLGALEELDEAEVRRQFEVNFFALLAMTREVLPQMRARGDGRVIQIGSVVGKFALPTNGAYSATKHAVEALCDAMRVEVAPFGIQIVLVEPGPIETGFRTNSQRHSTQFFQPASGSPYHGLHQAASRLITGRSARGAPVSKVSQILLRLVESRRPPSRVVITFRGWMMVQLRRWLPDCLWDAVVQRVLGI